MNKELLMYVGIDGLICNLNRLYVCV